MNYDKLKELTAFLPSIAVSLLESHRFTGAAYKYPLFAALSIMYCYSLYRYITQCKYKSIALCAISMLCRTLMHACMHCYIYDYDVERNIANLITHACVGALSHCVLMFFYLLLKDKFLGEQQLNQNQPMQNLLQQLQFLQNILIQNQLIQNQPIQNQLQQLQLTQNLLQQIQFIQNQLQQIQLIQNQQIQNLLIQNLLIQNQPIQNLLQQIQPIQNLPIQNQQQIQLQLQFQQFQQLQLRPIQNSLIQIW